MCIPLFQELYACWFIMYNVRVQLDSYLLRNFQFKVKQEAEAAWNSQLLRKTWHVNKFFELVLEQCTPNYWR